MKWISEVGRNIACQRNTCFHRTRLMVLIHLLSILVWYNYVKALFDGKRLCNTRLQMKGLHNLWFNKTVLIKKKTFPMFFYLKTYDCQKWFRCSNFVMLFVLQALNNMHFRFKGKETPIKLAPSLSPRLRVSFMIKENLRRQLNRIVCTKVSLAKLRTVLEIKEIVFTFRYVIY